MGGGYDGGIMCVSRRWCCTVAATLLLSLWTVTRSYAVQQEAPDTLPPNVVLIVADDLGSHDLHCYGSADLRTPNLDALAQRGVRFTQFYVAAPVCSPSRAALMTGRQPNRCGVPSNVSSRPNRMGLPPGEITIAELLKQQLGYRTALVGKWHLGTAHDGDALAQGFDAFFGHRGGCIDNWSHTMYWEGPIFHDLWRGRDEVFEHGTYFGDMMTAEATRFIGDNADRPFFLYLAFNVPHYPTHAPQKYADLYKDLPEPRRSYAATVSAMDDAIGAVLAKLDALRLRERTLVIFLSDHGHSTEERANFGGGNPGKLRGAKFSLFEGGIRVPCIMSFPNVIRGENPALDFPATSMDLFPTLADLCGARTPDDRRLDGVSLLSRLKADPVPDAITAPPPHDVLHWQIGDQWAVREGDWKLVVNAKDTSGPKEQILREPFLANLAEDPSESMNRAADQPEIVRRLTEKHQAWAATLKEW